jgi:hypothetical protein
MSNRPARTSVAELDALKNAGAAGEMDFTDAEWSAAVRKAMAGGRAEKSGRRGPAFHPVFAYALGALLAGVTILVGLRRFPWLVPTVENLPAGAGETVARSSENFMGIPADRDFADSDLWTRAEGDVFPASLFSRAFTPSTPEPAGDVPSFTWISEETGLQVVWFVNENITMEE